MIETYLQVLQAQLPSEVMLDLLSPDPLLCMAIKSKDNGYVYANNNYLKVMGFSKINGILHKTDSELYTDKNEIKTYEQDDEYIYSTGKPLQIQGVINPINHFQLNKMMAGAMFPLSVNSSSPDAVLVITKPENKIITLSINYLMISTVNQLQNILRKRSYKVKCGALNFTLARMEILCFSELLKGKSTNQVSSSLQIRKLTVESYLSNLKSKCGVNKKSDLIQFFIESEILENILV